MIKALSAVAVAAFIAAALTVLPGFAPQVEASVPVALAKGDRLDIKQVGRDCSEQAWPNFEASCLRPASGKQAGGSRGPAGNRRPHAVIARTTSPTSESVAPSRNPRDAPRGFSFSASQRAARSTRHSGPDKSRWQFATSRRRLALIAPSDDGGAMPSGGCHDQSADYATAPPTQSRSPPRSARSASSMAISAPARSMR